MKRAWPLALCVLCGACVTVAEPVLSPQAALPGQRTVLLVYSTPGPWVVSESESKAESAAKTMPLFSAVVQSFQDDRDKAAAEQLKQYVSFWRAGEVLEPLLRAELSRSGFPGRLIHVSETELDTGTLRGFNRALDVLDWQKKYYFDDPTQPPPRDYARLLSLDDALAYEANLLYYVAADDDGNMVPSLGVVTRLYRCSTMRLLWRHEDTVEDKGGARSFYEFVTLGQQLVDRWKALVPDLAKKMAASLRTALGQAPPAPPAPPSPFPTPPAPVLPKAPAFSPPPALSTGPFTPPVPAELSSSTLSVPAVPISTQPATDVSSGPVTP